MGLMPPAMAQATAAPQDASGGTLAALIARLQQPQSELNVPNPSAPQNPLGPFVPTTAGNQPTPLAGLPVAEPKPFQVGAQGYNRSANRRNDVAALVNNIQNMVHTAAMNKDAKNIRAATNTWNRLTTAMQNPDDPQNKAIIQDILGDPKTLRQMSKALNIDWLNPMKGADNVYRKAFGQAMAQHQVKESALGKLRDILTGGQPNVNLTPEQQKQLAAQMEARFPKTPQSSKTLKDEVDAAIYNKILKDPKSVSEEEWNMVSAPGVVSEVIRAQAQEQIADMNAQLKREHELNAALQNQSKDAVSWAQLMEKRRESDATRSQQWNEFQQKLDQNGQLRTRALDQADERLKIARENARTAADRSRVASQSVQVAKIKASMSLLTNQINADVRTRQADSQTYNTMIRTYTQQPSKIASFFTGEVGKTPADTATQAISDASAKVTADQAKIAGELQQQAALMQQLNSVTEQLPKAPTAPGGAVPNLPPIGNGH